MVNPLPNERGGSRTKITSLREEFGIPAGLNLRFLLHLACMFLTIIFNKFTIPGKFSQIPLNIIISKP
jgi:hypothetical protein